MITYEELKRIAPAVRAELAERGLIDPGRGKLRKRPREKDKLEMLYRAASNRAEKYKPYSDKDGAVVLPYFK